MMPGSPILLSSALLESALRALVASIAVWIVLRALHIGNVLVQKAAWSLVLAASIAMPLLPHGNNLPAWAAFGVPAIRLNQTQANPDRSSVPIADSSPKLVESFPPSSTASTTSTGAVHSSDIKIAAPHRSRMKQLEPPAPEAMFSAASAPSIPTADSPPPAVRAATQSEARNHLALFLLLLYLAVAVLLILRLLAGIVAAMRLWMTAVPIVSGVTSEFAVSICVRSGMKVTSPVNIGSGILLPADYTEWDEEKLRIVLAHERSHIRQGDFYLQILAGFYSCMFWFSPLGWWLKRKLYELGEAISDRAGLEEAASRTSYAQLLLEFAALPRPTLTGVAMARTNHLSRRIERLLNESNFRQAFAAGGRRALLAIGIVPVALFVATALVRVEAATAGIRPQAAAAPASTGQSTTPQRATPEPAADQVPTAPATAELQSSPQAAPAPPAPAASPSAVAAPLSVFVQQGPVPMAPLPPGTALVPMPPQAPVVVMPRYSSGFYTNRLYALPDRLEADSMRLAQSAELEADLIVAQAKQYLYRAYEQTSDGDPYAIVESGGRIVRPRNDIFRLEGGLNQESINQARAMAHGAFLWFEHEGKAYMVEDPSVVAQIEALDKPIEDVRSQMQSLGRQMRELGDQQRDLGKKMREITVPTPDLSKEIADLNAAAASLKAKEGGTISQKDLADMQREIGRIQGQLGQLQGKVGAQEGDLGGQMGKFGSQMGELGSQMGQLGKKMGDIARENQAKVKGIITDSLSNGKAKPVQ